MCCPAKRREDAAKGWEGFACFLAGAAKGWEDAAKEREGAAKDWESFAYFLAGAAKGWEGVANLLERFSGNGSAPV